MKHTNNKALSLLLTLTMLLGLIPWSVQSALADAPTAGAFAELQALLDAGGMVTLDRDYARGGSDSSTLVIAEDKTVTLDLNGHVIKGSSGARVFNVSGSLTLTDSAPTAAHTPAVTISGKTVTGGVITGGRSSSGNGGGVSVESGGRLTMNGGTICGNSAKNGGGVSVNGGTFTMNGGTVSGNTAGDFSSGSGGGVYVYNGGSFTMNGGEISGNTAGAAGGGVFNGSTFTMTGGVITGNAAVYANDGNGGGGGVYVNSTLFTVSGSPVICGNLYSGQPNNVFLKGTTIKGAGGLESGACIGVTTFGGGAQITDDWEINGTADASRFFSDDWAHYIVGILGNKPVLVSGAWSSSFPEAEGLSYVWLSNAYDSPITVCSGQYVTLNLNGVTVSGGITVEDGGSLTVIDGSPAGSGKITGSGVTVKGTLVLCGGTITGCSGSGVTVDGGTFVMEGGSITGNTAAEHGGGVYVKSGTFKVSGSAAITGNVTGGTIEDGVLSGGTAGNVCLAEGGKITVAGALTGGAGCIGVSMNKPGVFAQGDEDYTPTGGDWKRFTSDDGAYVVKLSGGEAELVKPAAQVGTTGYATLKEAAAAWNNGTTLTLLADVTTDSAIRVGDDEGNSARTVTLDLNGHSLLMTGNNCVIQINPNSKLTLKDSAATNKPVHKITLDENGRAAAVETVDKEGGDSATVKYVAGGCVAGGCNCGVYVNRGTFEMTGGTIIGNITEFSGGGVYVAYGGTFKVSGGAAITGNTASGEGGGVSVDGTFTMDGGTISGNTAKGFGGGVTVGNGTFTMSGGATVTGNTASGDGGGVYADGTFKVSGGASVKGNTRVKDESATKNNVYMGRSKTITVTGELTGSIGVSMNQPGVFTSGLANGGANAIKCFASDADGYAVKPSGDEAALAVEYSVANGKVTAPAGAVLILATYDASGRLTSSQTATVGEDCVNAALSTFFRTIPESYKLMLVKAGTYAPLCEAEVCPTRK